MHKWLAVFLTVLLIAGCKTESLGPNGEKIPRFASDVQVAMYISSPREKTDDIYVFDDPKSVQKPYKEIALLTCKGKANQEAPMTQAIVYRARMMGANAIITIRPTRFWNGDTIFRAKAIVYEKPE